MNLKKVLNTTLLVAAGMIMGATSAWGEGEIDLKKGNKIGAENNSTGWYGQASEIITLGYNKTLTLKFKTYTATDEQLTAASAAAWNDQDTHALNIWDGRDQNFYMKGCGWGWKAHKDGGVNEPADYDVNASTCGYYKDYGWAADYRTMIGDGADVVMTIARWGSELKITQEFTTSGGTKYNHVFLGTFGVADGDVWLQMTVQYAHIDITEDYSITDTEVGEITGTLIGKQFNTGRLAAHGSFENFTIAPEGSLNLNFKMDCAKIATWGTWLFEVADATRNIYTLCAGNKTSWGLVKDNLAASKGDTEVLTPTNWPATDAELLEKMDGASVAVTIVRSGAKVTMTAVHTPKTGEPFTLVSEITPSETTSADFATQNITVRLLAELSHLDLLPVTKTITSAGWATYCSPYALNLAAAKGLTDAYIVTGGAAGVLTKTSVKDGTVPANTGLLLKGSEGSSVDVTIPIVGSSTTDVSANKLVGKTESYSLEANGGYVLMDDATNGLGFYKNNNAFTVGANTAYLPVGFDSTGAPAFFSLEGNTTAIETVKAQKVENGEYYNLAGQRVAQPTKGLYIVNGKKVIVK